MDGAKSVTDTLALETNVSNRVEGRRVWAEAPLKSGVDHARMSILPVVTR